MSQNNTQATPNHCIVLRQPEITQIGPIFAQPIAIAISCCLTDAYVAIRIFLFFGASRAILLIRETVFRDSHLKP